MSKQSDNSVKPPGQSYAHALLDAVADRLPTPDGMSLAIIRASQDEDTTIEEMAKLIQTDPALTGRLLKLANSAATGVRSVGSMPEAIIRVGMKTVCQMALAFSLIGREPANRCANFDYELYWSTSLLMAVLARKLAEETRLGLPADLFACGLLARIGVLGLASVYPEAYANILDERPGDLCTKEREQFGLDHNELSEAMMLDFYIPRTLAEPARYHEAPERSGFDRQSRPQKISVLLNLAYRLASMATQGHFAVFTDAAMIDAICARLGLPEDRIQSIYETALVEWKEWLKMLELHKSDVLSYDDLIGAAESASSQGQAESHSLVRGLSAALLAKPPVSDNIINKLRELDIPVHVCKTTSDALQLVKQGRANLFLLSEEYAYFIKLIRGTEFDNSSYLIWLTSGLGKDEPAKAYEAGCDATLPADIAAHDLVHRLQPASRMLTMLERWREDREELRRIAKELALTHRQQQDLAMTDALTKLPNRQAAMYALEKAWSASLRSDSACAVLAIDLDNFQKINSDYGHQAGDKALRAVSKILRETIHSDEVIARVGGEKFLVISGQSSIREAVASGERLRRTLKASTLPIGENEVTITASIGVAVRLAGIKSTQELMMAADQALNAAKEAGRDRLGLFQSGQVRVLSLADSGSS